MARERSIKRDQAFELYKSHKGNIKLVDIAKELEISDVQVRKWKSQDKWDDNLKGTLPKNKSNTKSNVTNKKVTKKKVKKEAFEDEVKEVLENTNLTDKQKLFCVYYAKYFNATKAYLKAYECGYNTANNNGPELLVKTCIQDEINRLKASRFKGAMLEPGDILQKYIDIAFADITDYLEFGQEEVPIMAMFGPLKDEEGNEITKLVNTVRFNQSSDVDGTIISEVKQGKDGASIKLQDKMKALEVLKNNIGLLDIETQQKLEMEREKIDILKAKSNLNNKGNDNGNIDQLIDAITRSKA